MISAICNQNQTNIIVNTNRIEQYSLWDVCKVMLFSSLSPLYPLLSFFCICECVFPHYRLFDPYMPVNIAQWQTHSTKIKYYSQSNGKARNEYQKTKNWKNISVLIYDHLRPIINNSWCFILHLHWFIGNSSSRKKWRFYILLIAALLSKYSQSICCKSVCVCARVNTHQRFHFIAEWFCIWMRART